MIEVVSLCMVPAFVVAQSISALLTFLVVSGLSSTLILLGLLFPDLYLLIGYGLYIKFGLFPFMGWVYNVIGDRESWLVIWVVSVILKVPVLYVTFFFWGYSLEFSLYLAIVSLLILSVNFWVMRVRWQYIWCHMMISSSIVMFVLGEFMRLLHCVAFIAVYTVWASGVLYYLSGARYVIGYIFWLLAVPFRFSLIYKLYAGYLLSGYVSLLFFWFIYSLSEQFYLIK